MRKRILSLALAAVTALSLMGCGSSGGGSQTTAGGQGTTQAEAAGKEDQTTKADGGEAVELEVWVRDSFYDMMTVAAKKYMEKNPRIKIEVMQPENVSDQFALAISSGQTPDIVSMDCVLVPYFSSIGALADITDRFDKLEYKDTFSGGLLDLAKYEGKQYAVPFGPDVSVLLYNKDQFKEAGLDPEQGPKTWDELTEYAQKLTKDGHYGYVYGAADAGTMMFTYVPYIWSNGGEVLASDGSRSMLDQPEAVGALQFICDLANKYKVTPSGITSYGWTESQDAFKTGTAGMVVLGSAAVWNMLTADEVNFDVGVCLIPSPDGKNFASFSGGDSIAMVEGSSHPDEAWDFIQYCLSEEIQVEELAQYGMLPARSDLFDNQYFNDKPEFQVMKEALRVGHAPYSLKYNEMYAPFLDGVQSALNGQMTPEEASKKAVEKINQILAE
ncbi:ABC transporter substrate-binding protein [Lacrimispora brassicae]